MDKKNPLKKLCKGFTLLEILFVIVILASLMVSWVLYTQRHSTAKIVDKTVEQMLQLLAASRSYFSGQLYYWPESFDDLVNNGYIIDSGRCSSWQLQYSPHSACNGATKESYRMYWSNTDDHLKAKQFGISIVVPSEKIAKQIAARLPMYKFGTQGNSGEYIEVTALTTVPAMAIDLEGKIIKIGTVMNNQMGNSNDRTLAGWSAPIGNSVTDAQHGYVKKPNCPDPLVPAIFFTAYDYTMAYAATGAGGPTRSTDVWCETGVKDPNSSTQLSKGFNSYVPSGDGRYCTSAGGTPQPAYAGPQYCDYAPELNLYYNYWRLNYWACQNKGASLRDGVDASIIYFVTCLDPTIKYNPNLSNNGTAFFYPFCSNQSNK